MSEQEFPQYQLKCDDGAVLTVDQHYDQVVVHQTSQGTMGRGAALLSPNEAAELARQIQEASEAARRYAPPVEIAPAAGQLSPSPVVQQLIEQLGPAGIAALVSAVNQAAAQQAEQRQQAQAEAKAQAGS